jgi:hypothetical protein
MINSMSYVSLYSLAENCSRKLPLPCLIVLIYGMVTIGTASTANSVMDLRSYFTHMITLIPNHPSPQLGHTEVTVDRFTIAGNLREAIRSL